MEEEVSTGQQRLVRSGGEKLVVFEPGHLSCRSAVRRPAGDCDVFSSLHRLVDGLLDEAPVHFWKDNSYFSQAGKSHFEE